MKAKKSIYIICLALILVLSSFLLFACGKKESSASTYKAFDSLMTTMRKDGNLFSTNTIHGVSTTYYFNDFYEKDSQGSELHIYNHYIALTAESLNFIEAYYPQLETVKIKTDYSDLKDDVKALKKRYEKLSKEYTNLINNATELDYTIYNGYFARYRTYALKFINETYDCALSLGKFLDEKVNLDKGVDNGTATSDNLTFFLSYNCLKVFDDMREFFLDSCKGLNISGDEYNSVMASLTNWATLSTKVVTVTAEELKELSSLMTYVNNDRKMAQKALSKFSMYKYTTTYESSLTAYKKASEHAPIYYDRLASYFWGVDTNASTLDNLYACLLDYTVA